MVDRFGRHPVSRRTRCKSAAPAAWQQQLALDAAPELCVENEQARKAAYLATLSHPHNTHSQCGALLRVPGSLSHVQVRDAILDACAHPVSADAGNAAKGCTVELEFLVVYRERHSAGDGDVLHAHYHIAVKGKRFRYLPVKRALLQRHGLASHWSDTHEGYWSCVRYGYWPSPPHKPLIAANSVQQIQTDRLTDRHTDTQTHTDRRPNKHTDCRFELSTDRPTDRQTDNSLPPTQSKTN